MVGVLSDKQRNCDHIFVDVTEERRASIESRALPSWAKLLIEKEDPKWREPKDRYKTLRYLKCSECGLLRVKDEEIS